MMRAGWRADILLVMLAMASLCVGMLLWGLR